MLPSRRSYAPLLAVLFWTVPALVFTTQNYAAHLQTDHPLSWWRVLRWELPNWYAWGLVAPAILWLTRALHTRRIPRWRMAAALLVAMVAAALLQSWLHVTALWVLGWNARPWTALGPVYLANVRSGFAADILVYLLIVAVALALQYQRAYRERELARLVLQGELAQSQLHMLRMQLQPHFLFNALHAISGMMARDVDAARTMIARLGDLLRAAMQVDAHEVPLREELELLRLYLELERLRFPERLSVDFRIDPAMLDACVPKLLLQPLVENALEHGIAARPTPGRVEIRAEGHDGSLRLEVRDDGPGLWARGAAAGPGERIGVGNTRARLRHLYGEGHRFELGNSAAGGCVVIIEIPHHTHPASPPGAPS